MHFKKGYPVNHAKNYGKDYPRMALEQVMMLFRKFHNHYQMKNLQKI